MVTLCDLKQGDKAKVAGFETGEVAERQQLLSMGLTPGTMFTLKRIAPLGDPVEISLRGYRLSLRKRDAKLLQLIKVN